MKMRHKAAETAPYSELVHINSIIASFEQKSDDPTKAWKAAGELVKFFLNHPVKTLHKEPFMALARAMTRPAQMLFWSSAITQALDDDQELRSFSRRICSLEPRAAHRKEMRKVFQRPKNKNHLPSKQVIEITPSPAPKRFGYGATPRRTTYQGMELSWMHK